jgi:lysophospholipase L1-like esterase
MTTSDYLFAHFSSWFGTRSHLRVFLLQWLLPGADQLATYVAPAARGSDGPADLSRALQRLRQLQQLCASHGAAFALLIPPTLRASDPGPELAVLAAQSGIPVLIPYRPGEMPRVVFADGFHLDPRGAELFTARLTQQLPAVLGALPD